MKVKLSKDAIKYLIESLHADLEGLQDIGRYHYDLAAKQSEELSRLKQERNQLLLTITELKQKTQDLADENGRLNYELSAFDVLEDEDV